MRGRIHPTPLSLQAIKTPEGLRSGRAVAMQAKLDAAVAYARRSHEALEAAKFEPSDYPVLVAPRQVVSTKRTHSQRRVSTGGAPPR